MKKQSIPKFNFLNKYIKTKWENCECFYQFIVSSGLNSDISLLTSIMCNYWAGKQLLIAKETEYFTVGQSCILFNNNILYHSIVYNYFMKYHLATSNGISVVHKQD